ncbi:MAG: hypothetical protein NTW01_09035 [Gammaproteobacteria bacterium]|uniref:hypothetical protein n=1 Tax=Nevskia sp. TaxID=1929292 RepID=UPI004035B76C|nr:hypothetical protein [Gammaproteobacteria bacterium]
MKRSLIAAALLLAAGSAAAAPAAPQFGLLNGRGATAALLAGTPALPGGLGNSVPLFFAGNSVDGFAAGRNGFSSAVIVLTADTPRLHGLRDTSVKMFNTFYDTLLPLYQAADPLLVRLTTPAEPLLTPVGATIADAAVQLAIAIDGTALRLGNLRSANAGASLPGLEGLSFRR